MNNKRTGIDCNLSGTEGVDWWEEARYFDPLIMDRRVISVRDSTDITFEHNALNSARATGPKYDSIGANGLDGVPNSGDEGKIRYRVDGDLFNPGTSPTDPTTFKSQWADASTTLLWPQYTTPLRFSTLTYPSASSVSGQPVLHSIGGSGHGTLTSPQYRFFYRGLLDANGDEHHTITVADDDWSLQSWPDNDVRREFSASDGKVYHTVVNRNTPVLKFAVTGNAQFYTTPIKTYRVPKIHEQISYLWTGSGTITCSLKALSGDNVFYRINGGSWQNGSAPTFTDSDLSTGSNTLEYYVAGNSGNVKTRVIHKNPTHPSLAENHGYLLFGNEENYQKVLTRITQQPYKYHYDLLVSSVNAAGGRKDFWDTKRRTGKRFEYSTQPISSLGNAIAAKIRGVTGPASVASPAYANWTYAQVAKEMILENSATIDWVGIETFNVNTALPCRDVLFRGYFDVNTDLEFALTYDLLVSIYRSDQVAGGITPVEDYYLRDCMAERINACLFERWGPTRGTGMWDTSRYCGAILMTLAMPSYSTPYYGTCGLDGNTTVYPYTPFINTPLTWRKAFLDDDAPTPGYPDLGAPVGIVPWNVTEGGDFVDSSSYVEPMGLPLYHVMNVLKYHYPSKSYPQVEAFFRKAAEPAGVLGLKNGQRARKFFLPMYNENFPSVADVGIPAVKDVPGVDGEGQQINGRVWASLAWYNRDYVPSSGGTVAPTFTLQPVGATRLAGESITFSISVSGTAPFTYQWRKDGAPIGGATSTTYAIATLNTGHAGNYDCVASNAAGSVTSGTAVLVVNELPPEPVVTTKRTRFRSNMGGLFGL